MSREKRKAAETPRRLFYVLALLGVLLVVLTFLALQGVGRWERYSLDIVYGTTDSWRTPALLVTQLGSAWFWLGLVALLFIIRRRPGAALVMFRNGAIAYAVVTVLKVWIARPRPEFLVENVVSREVTTVGLGFPSAHATIATVMALTLWPYCKGLWRWGFLVAWIVGVAWSRLYLGVHAPLDVLGGIVLGAFIVLAGRFLPDRGIWKQAPDSHSQGLKTSNHKHILK